MKEVTYNGLAFEPYIESDRIKSRIQELAAQITEEYRGRRPLMLCVLNGAFPFASELFMNLETDAEISFIRLKSYCGTCSGGAVKEVLGLTENIEGRPVIVVEDIIDTGNTIKMLIERLEGQKPESVKVATLLFKPESLVVDVTPDYVGFSIGPKFIIGFGLDVDGQGRNLRDIYILKGDN